MTFAAESAAAWESIRLFGGRSQSLLQRTPKDPFHLHGVPIKYFSALSLIFVIAHLLIPSDTIFLHQ